MASATLLIFSALLFYSSTFSHACITCPEALDFAPSLPPFSTKQSLQASTLEASPPALTPLAPIPPAPAAAPSTPSPLTPITPAPAVAPSTPLTPAPSPSSEACPRDMLKLGVCANVMGIPIGGKKPCCALLKGMVDFEVALCLCTALKANVIGVNLKLPIALNLILSACQKTLPLGFQCA